MRRSRMGKANREVGGDGTKQSAQEEQTGRDSQRAKRQTAIGSGFGFQAPSFAGWARNGGVVTAGGCRHDMHSTNSDRHLKLTNRLQMEESSWMNKTDWQRLDGRKRRAAEIDDGMMV